MTDTPRTDAGYVAAQKQRMRAALDVLQNYLTHEVEISIEQGAGTVYLRNPDGNLEATMDVDSDNRLSAEINAAIDAALALNEERKG